MISTLRRRLCLTAPIAFAASTSALAIPKGNIPVTVLHWWTSEGEQIAANCLQDHLKASNIQWMDMPIPGGGGMAAVKVLKSRVLMGAPPDAAQLIGTTLVDWADAGLVVPLNGVAAEHRWAQAISKTVQKKITHRGQTIAVPLGVHRINTLYVNKPVFQRFGLQPPTTWAEYEKVSSILRQQRVQPLAWSDQAWQIATVFESVLLSYVGGEGYLRLMEERAFSQWMGGDVREALMRLRWLRSNSSNNPTELTWTSSARLLKENRAAMMIMGDWVSGELQAWGSRPSVDFQCYAVPETAGMHLYSLDTLAMLKSPRQLQTTQEKMAEVLTSVAAQMDYNLAKGSVPVRNDIDPNALGECARDSWLNFQDPKTIRVPSLAHRMVADEVTKDAVAKVLWRFITLNVDVAEIQTRLAMIMRKTSASN